LRSRSDDSKLHENLLIGQAVTLGLLKFASVWTATGEGVVHKARDQRIEPGHESKHLLREV